MSGKPRNDDEIIELARRDVIRLDHSRSEHTGRTGTSITQVNQLIMEPPIVTWNIAAYFGYGRGCIKTGNGKARP